MRTHNTFRVATLLAATLSLLSLLAACAGGGSGTALLPEAGALHAEKQGFSLKVLEESFVDGGSADFGLRVEQQGEETVVSIEASRARGLKALYFELDYDAARFDPLEARATGLLAGRAEGGNAGGSDLLELASLSEPGQASCGQVLAQWDRQAGFSGTAVLARLRFAMRPCSVEARSPSTALAEQPFPLTLSGGYGDPALSWHYENRGDYDQNGLVSIADLTPLGQHLGEAQDGGYSYHSIEYVIDGDGNGEINIADLTPLGAQLGNRIQGYRIYRSSNPDNDYAESGGPSLIDPIDYLPLMFLQHGDYERHEQMHYELDSIPVPTDVFWVRAVEDTGLEAATSNRSDRSNGFFPSWAQMYLSVDKLSGDVPLTLQLDASASVDPDGSLEYYEFSARSDLHYIESGDLATPQGQLLLTKPGNYEVKVTGKAGNSGSPSRSITVCALDNGNAVPVSDSNVPGPGIGDAPFNVVIDMSASSDADGDALTYELDFFGNVDGKDNPQGDFEIDNGSDPICELTLDKPGYYDFDLRVTDTQGHSHKSYGGQIHVTQDGNLLPRAMLIMGSPTGDAPQEISFNVMKQSYDTDGEIVRYELDAEGKGEFIEIVDPTDVRHTYAEAGLYLPRLRVTDNLGATGLSQSHGYLLISGPAGTAPEALLAASETNGLFSLEVEFDASGSSDANGIVRLYEFNLGTGYFSNGSNPLFQYTFGVGEHEVKLRVTDNQGLSAETGVLISVSGLQL